MRREVRPGGKGRQRNGIIGRRRRQQNPRTRIDASLTPAFMDKEESNYTKDVLEEDHKYNSPTV